MPSDPIPGLLEAGDRARLIEVLRRAQALGFIGPGPIEAQIERSLGLIEALEATAVETVGIRALDLGSGGGLPGLVLAVALPRWRWTLMDGSVTRCDLLVEAIDVLGLAASAVVVAARAEDAARTALRGSFDLVVARGFAAAAPTAECAAPFLRLSGRLLVTEPPGGAPERWPAAPLAELGLVDGGRTTTPVATQAFTSVAPCPQRYPRRNGVPTKRPLWQGRPS